MKKVLLASTALAGASLLATSANAGTPIVSDNQEVEISGTMRFSIHGAGQDVRSPLGGQQNEKGEGRGYKFASDESEVKFAARAAADNGLEFGLEIEIQTQTDDQDNSDETWIFLQFEGAGRVELGDQDGAADRIFVAAEDVLAGRGGFDGPTNTLFNFGSIELNGPSVNETGDATKATYFTPRFGGFQAGVSYTVDAAQQGGAAEPDDNGTYENVVSLGANFQQTFNNVGVIISAVGEFAEDDSDGDSPDRGDLEIWAVGANVTFGGFAVGLGYSDWGETREDSTGAGEDVRWFNAGASYTTGPWKFSVGGYYTENDGGAGQDDPELTIISGGLTYTIAPGLAVKTDINYLDCEDCFDQATVGENDNEGWTFVLSLDGSF